MIAGAGDAELLRREGLAADACAAWLAATPAASGDFRRDADAFARFWRLGAALKDRLPPKPARSATEQAAAAFVMSAGRAARERFLGTHAGAVYRALTNDRAAFHRVEDLIYAAARAVPGLAPTHEEVAREDGMQRDKDGV